MYPLPVMAAPGAARFLQTAVSRSYRQDDSKTNERKSRWDPLIHAVPHGAASESAFAHRTGKGEVTDEWICGCQGAGKVSSEELPSPIVMKLIGCQPCSANITLNFSTAIFNDFATA